MPIFNCDGMWWHDGMTDDGPGKLNIAQLFQSWVKNTDVSCLLSQSRRNHHSYLRIAEVREKKVELKQNQSCDKFSLTFYVCCLKTYVLFIKKIYFRPLNALYLRSQVFISPLNLQNKSFCKIYHRRKPGVLCTKKRPNSVCNIPHYYPSL